MKIILVACFIANVVMAVLFCITGDISRVLWHCLLGALSVAAFVNE